MRSPSSRITAISSTALGGVLGAADLLRALVQLGFECFDLGQQRAAPRIEVEDFVDWGVGVGVAIAAHGRDPVCSRISRRSSTGFSFAVASI